MGGPRSSSSSNGEEDGDAEWLAAINSVTSAATHNSNGHPSFSAAGGTHDREDEKHKHQNIKHYQIKISIEEGRTGCPLHLVVETFNLYAILIQQSNDLMKRKKNAAQKLLDAVLEKTIEVVTNTADTLEKCPPPSDAGVRLFKHAPSGIVFDPLDEVCGPKKKPKIVPGQEIQENSKRFRKQVQSVAVDGADIIAAARAEGQKSLYKLEAREAMAKAAAKREEERVAELKKVRGERWLPCMVREMRMNGQRHG